MNLDALERALRDPDCMGAGAIQLLAETEFWDEDGLPFEILGGGSIIHLVPDTGFRKEHLASFEEERMVIADHPEGGWLVPDDVVAHWMNRHVDCPPLEDLVLAHPLYEYLTRLDEDGHSRGGHRGELIQWAPGIPTLASIYAPEFLPDDPDAPKVNRERGPYAAAVVDLLEQLDVLFGPVEMEVGVRYGEVWVGDDEE